MRSGATSQRYAPTSCCSAAPSSASAGAEQKSYDEAAIARMLRDYGVSLVVAQPGFWTDLEEMRRFEAVLHTPDVTRVAQLDITGTEPHDDNSIEIYQPTYAVTQSRKGLQLDMPIIGRKFRVKFNSGRPGGIRTNRQDGRRRHAHPSVPVGSIACARRVARVAAEMPGHTR